MENELKTNINDQEKDLLLKDLRARLPYGVKVKIGNNSYTVKGVDKKVNGEGDWVHCVCSYGISPVEIDFCKPYLFPISSMTEEQKKDMIMSSVGIGSDKNVFDWYNKNHIDYRGLIPMGLANDATGLNIY